MASKKEIVQTFGRKKTSVAAATIKPGKGMVRVNGVPLEILEPELLRVKVFEPILLLGQKRVNMMDVRIRVRGGGYTS